MIVGKFISEITLIVQKLVDFYLVLVNRYNTVNMCNTNRKDLPANGFFESSLPAGLSKTFGGQRYGLCEKKYLGSNGRHFRHFDWRGHRIKLPL